MDAPDSESVVLAAMRVALGPVVLEPPQGEPPQRPDLIMSSGGIRYVAEIKIVAQALVDDVLSRLAMATLQATRLALECEAVPMAAVVVPTLGRKVVREAVRFMEINAPLVAWALADAAGNMKVVVPQLAVDVEHLGLRVGAPRPSRTSQYLFSDVNRWLLKVLLLNEVSAGLWGGPRKKILRRSDLIQVSGVSPEMVRRFWSAFEQQGFLRQGRDGVQLVRRSVLWDMWRSDEILDARRPIPVRDMFGLDDAVNTILSRQTYVGAKSGNTPLVVGGFEACRLLGLIHTAAPVKPEIHIFRPVDEILEQLLVEKCDARDADLFLVQPRNLRSGSSRSIVDGAVIVDGRPVVDALQAALDVLRHPARGAEQSEYIVRNVLNLTREGDE
ncbi:MAG TPA: hypothetical protein PKK50_08190 [Myxococcota bacterium]|nr:hypothetical protein [Myxococcota bacterium]HPV05261.1 hypothetical protein [Myxococcota bacterium]